MSKLVPTRIIDKNGKSTTVHKKSEASLRNTRNIPSASSSDTNASLFHGFERMHSNDSSIVLFKDDKNSYGVYYGDDDNNIYVISSVESKDILHAWLENGKGELVFESTEYAENFKVLGEETISRLKEAMGDFKASRGYVRIPDDIDAREATPASKFIGERVTDRNRINAQANYAEVNNEGVAYGLSISSAYIGEIFAGKQFENESESEYRKRSSESISEHITELESYFEKEYDGYLSDAGGGLSNVEFYLDYEDGGAISSSIEWMNERAERETRLHELFDNYTDTADLQNDIAQNMGYHWVKNEAPDKNLICGYWEKDNNE